MGGRRSSMFLLRLLGTVSIEGPDGVVTGRAARRHALALLVLLAVSRSRRVGRDKLIGYLWPESGTSAARNLLNQSVHALRRAMGRDAIRSEGDELVLNPDAVVCDVWAFEEALESGEAERAVELYAGPFADGLFLTDALKLERWVDGERERLRRGYVKALEELAEGASARGDAEGASGWWGTLRGEEPYNANVTLGLMRALESAGDRAGAIREAEAHAERLRADLDAAPSPAVLALAERMRTQPAGPGPASASSETYAGAGHAAAYAPGSRLAPSWLERVWTAVTGLSSRSAERAEGSLRAVEHLTQDAQPAGDLTRVTLTVDRATSPGSASSSRAPGPAIAGTRSLIREVHTRRLWQLTLFYIGGVWACSEIIGAVSDRLALPTWFSTLALILLLTGLPIVLATAFVQRGGPLEGRFDTRGSLGRRDPLISLMRRWLTWRRAIAGGVSVFALFGFATAGYVTMRALGIGPLGTLMTKGILQERDLIVLADFEDHTGDSTLAPTVTEALRVDLGQSRVVRVAERAYVDRLLERMERGPGASLTYDVAREAAIREGLKAVLTGEINRAGSGYVLSARLIASETGEELCSFRETATELDAIIPAIDRLSSRLRAKIGESLQAMRAGPPLSQARTASLQALRLQTEAVRANLRGERQRALNLLDRAIEIDTLFAEAYRSRASVLGNMGINRAQRLADATRAFELRHRLPLWERYWVEAQYYGERGDPEKVIEAYRTLLELRDHPGAVQNLGVAYEGLRQYSPAEGLYRRRLEMDSLAGTSWITLSRVQFNLGKFAEADETLRRFESKLPEHPSIPLARARFASARGDHEAAEAILRSLRDRERLNSLRRAYLNQFMGRLAQVQGKLTEAERLFLDAMAGFEERGLAVKYLETGIELASLSVWFMGDTARALQAMAAAEERHPLDSMEPPERPYLALARFYAFAGESERTRQLLLEWERALSPDLRRPQEAIHRAALAASALAEGRADDAVRESRLAYERDGCPVCLLPLLGGAYEAAGQADSAVALYERYLTTPFFGRTIAGYLPEYFSDPQWLPVVYERLGELYEQRADTARAINYYGRLVDLWKDADADLWPRVEAARRAIEAHSLDR